MKNEKKFNPRSKNGNYDMAQQSALRNNFSLVQRCSCCALVAEKKELSRTDTPTAYTYAAHIPFTFLAYLFLFTPSPCLQGHKRSVRCRAETGRFGTLALLNVLHFFIIKGKDIETVQTRTRVKVKGSALLFLECDIFIIHSFLSYPLVRCGS